MFYAAPCPTDFFTTLETRHRRSLCSSSKNVDRGILQLQSGEKFGRACHQVNGKTVPAFLKSGYPQRKTINNFNAFLFFLSLSLSVLFFSLPFLPICVFYTNFTPTDPFTISQPQNPAIDEFYGFQKRCSKYFQGSEIVWNVRSGHGIIWTTRPDFLTILNEPFATLKLQN